MRYSHPFFIIRWHKCIATCVKGLYEVKSCPVQEVEERQPHNRAARARNTCHIRYLCYRAALPVRLLSQHPSRHSMPQQNLQASLTQPPTTAVNHHALNPSTRPQHHHDPKTRRDLYDAQVATTSELPFEPSMRLSIEKESIIHHGPPSWGSQVYSA